MGCDIHLFAEAKRKRSFIDKIRFWVKPSWEPLEKWQYNSEYERMRPVGKFYSHGRNYNLFAALCGVRAASFVGNPARISRPRGIPPDACKEIKQEVGYWSSDGHSHNFNTLKELKSFDWSDWGDTVRDFLNEVIPKMEAAGVGEDDVRIVYFFDN